MFEQNTLSVQGIFTKRTRPARPTILIVENELEGLFMMINQFPKSLNL